MVSRFDVSPLGLGPDSRALAATQASARATAASRYAALEDARRPYLERARVAARLTIPALMPPEHASGGTDLPTPHQGVGARGVNNLANKLLLAQFPPNAAFFRLDVDDAVAHEARRARRADGASLEASLQAALQRIERDVMRDVEQGFFRAGLHAALKQLVVSGNVLLHAPPEGGLRVFRLDRYVARRDPMGGLLELVVRESAPAELAAERLGGSAGSSVDGRVDLYTWLRRDGDGWSAHQEAEGRILEGTQGRYPLGATDWMALRWTHVDGEDYGRGHVEEFIGDLQSLEGLTQAIVEGAAAASKITLLVSPNGQTDAEALAEAENGAIIDGEAGDVSILQSGKTNDFRVAFESVKLLTDRLGFAFLLNSAVQRGGRDVTAEEIRFVAAELEDALGGVYSVLAEELQQPLVRAILGHKAAQGRLPPLPRGVLTPRVVTGLDALGRGQDLEKLRGFLDFAGDLAKLAGGPAGRIIDVDAALLRAASAMGLEATALLRGGVSELAAKRSSPRRAGRESPATDTIDPETSRRGAKGGPAAAQRRSGGDAEAGQQEAADFDAADLSEVWDVIRSQLLQALVGGAGAADAARAARDDASS